MLLVETSIGVFSQYLNLWNGEFSLGLRFVGLYEQKAAWTVGNVIITAVEIAPGRVRCEFDNFNLLGWDGAARSGLHRLVGLLHTSFPVADATSADPAYGLSSRQIHKTLRAFPTPFADTEPDVQTRAKYETYVRQSEPDISEEEFTKRWQNIVQDLEVQKAKRRERERRQTMTANDAAKEWRESVLGDSADYHGEVHQMSLNQVQRQILQVIDELSGPSKNRGVGDENIAERTHLPLQRVKDHLEMLEEGRYINLTKTFDGFIAMATARGRLALDDPPVTASHELGVEDESAQDAKPQKLDVFLCHASADKREYVLPLAAELESRGITYWLDADEIGWGDKITQEMNRGLRDSRYVIVFLSAQFLDRNWPESELGSALSRENNAGQTVVLPLILRDKDKVLNHYPLLEEKMYLEWSDGIPKIVDALQSKLT